MRPQGRPRLSSNPSPRSGSPHASHPADEPIVASFMCVMLVRPCRAAMQAMRGSIMWMSCTTQRSRFAWHRAAPHRRRSRGKSTAIASGKKQPLKAERPVRRGVSVRPAAAVEWQWVFAPKTARDMATWLVAHSSWRDETRQNPEVVGGGGGGRQRRQRRDVCALCARPWQGGPGWYLPSGSRPGRPPRPAARPLIGRTNPQDSSAHSAPGPLDRPT